MHDTVTKHNALLWMPYPTVFSFASYLLKLQLKSDYDTEYISFKSTDTAAQTAQ